MFLGNWGGLYGWAGPEPLPLPRYEPDEMCGNCRGRPRADDDWLCDMCRQHLNELCREAGEAIEESMEETQ